MMQLTVSIVDELGDAARPYHQILRVKWDQAVFDRDSYLRYLTETYHYVVASVPVMKFARARPEVQSDERYRLYLDEHIVEERDHDVWLLEDLNRLGISAQSVRNTLPLPPTRQIPGIAYYTIAHLHPIGLMGYIYALESAPPTDAHLDELLARCGISDESVRTLREHGERDIQHRQEMLHFIDGYPFDDWQRRLVVDTTLCTLRLAIDLFETLIHHQTPRSVDE